MTDCILLEVNSVLRHRAANTELFVTEQKAHSKCIYNEKLKRALEFAFSDQRTQSFFNI